MTIRRTRCYVTHGMKWSYTLTTRSPRRRAAERHEPRHEPRRRAADISSSAHAHVAKTEPQACHRRHKTCPIPK